MKIPSDQLTLDCIKELGDCKWKEIYLWGLDPHLSECDGIVNGAVEIVTERNEKYYFSTNLEENGPPGCAEDYRLICTKQYIQSPAFSPNDGERVLIEAKGLKEYLTDQNEIAMLERSLPYFSVYSNKIDPVMPPDSLLFFPFGGKNIPDQHKFTVDCGIIIRSKSGKKMIINSGDSSDVVEITWNEDEIKDMEKETHTYKL